MLKSTILLGIVSTLLLVVAMAPRDADGKGSCPNVGFAVVEVKASPETREIEIGKDKAIFIHRDPITTTRDIADFKLVKPSEGDKDDVLIMVKFTPVADKKLHDATTNHPGMRLAFLANDHVLLNVVWQGTDGLPLGGTQLSIRHGMSNALELQKAMRGCTSAQ